MTISSLRHALGVLTILGLGGLLMPSEARAQMPVQNNDGRALDANNRIGSGGYNGGPSQSSAVSGNQIANGNVTGGFAFRGISVDGINVGSGIGAPQNFGGPLLPGTGIDQFTANSTGVPTMANPNASSAGYARGPQPFYGQTQTVQIPPGYQVLPNGLGIVPLSPTSVAQNPADTRLGNPAFVPGQSISVLPKPNEVFLPGPVDPTANPVPSMYAASPLYGVQQLPAFGQANQSAANSTTGNTPSMAVPTGNSQFGGPMDPAQIQFNNAQNQQMLIRQQLAAAAANGTLPPGQTPNGALPPLTPTGPASAQPLQPLQPTPGGLTAVNPISMAPMPGQVDTAQSSRRYLDPLDLPAAAQQSSQYAELRRRMDAYNASHPQTDEEADREFRSLLRARRALENSSAPGNISVPNVPSSPGAAVPVVPGVVTPDQANSSASIAKPAPLQIDSLATGVKSSTLGDLLHQGEDQISHQQYDEAIRVFDNAERAVPNNPLIYIGRAEAELGGSYYRQADMDLREAFRLDNAVLLSQYDLKRYLGEDRIQFIMTSLKQISTDSPENTTAPFLLAYVAYNTHQESLAGQYLDDCGKRSGGSDETVVLLKRYWNLKSSSPSLPSSATRPDDLLNR
jgi:hypothetical protein